MVDRNVIRMRIEQIDGHLKKISVWKGLSYEQFLQDTVAQDVVEYNLFQISNHIIDILQHIVVDESYGLPQTAYAAAEILWEKKIISRGSLDLIKKIIGFRNIVGHEYIHINKKIVYSILTKDSSGIKKVAAKIARRFL